MAMMVSTWFYQKYWNSIGIEDSDFALNVLNQKSSIHSVNDTYITLISKVKVAQIVTDFRIISLCNVWDKIVVKTLANRLKVILPSLISPYQSVFVLDRHIIDNILIANEALHSLTHRWKGRHRYMAITLDMSKVYDRLEWDFLKAVLCRMVFKN